MEPLYKQYFLILVLLHSSNFLASNILTASLTAIGFFKKKEVVEYKRVIDSSDFINMTSQFEESLISLMESQNNNDFIINAYKDEIKKIEKEENKGLENLADENNESNLNLEDLFNRKKELEHLIKNLQIMPFLRIEGKNNAPSVSQIYHTNELDKTNTASIACGPYTVAFLCAMNEMVNNPAVVISKEALEQSTQFFFHPTNETLDEVEMIGRVNNLGKYLFYILNYNTGKKYDKEFYDIEHIFGDEIIGTKYREKEVEFDNAKDRLSYRVTDYDDNQKYLNLSEKEIQKIIKEIIKNNIRNNEIVHFMTRVGEDRGHGHWFYLGWVPQTHPQTGIYYINNVNGFSDETKFIAENLQKLVFKALNK